MGEVIYWKHEGIPAKKLPDFQPPLNTREKELIWRFVSAVWWMEYEHKLEKAAYKDRLPEVGWNTMDKYVGKNWWVYFIEWKLSRNQKWELESIKVRLYESVQYLSVSPNGQAITDYLKENPKLILIMDYSNWRAAYGCKVKEEESIK